MEYHEKKVKGNVSISMKNPNIAKTLRHYREENNFTVKEISEKLKERDVTAAVKTIYAWENATTQPPSDTLMLLCEMYDIPDVLEAFGYKSPKKENNFILTQEESRLITEFRNQPKMQKKVLQLLNIGVTKES